MMSASLPKYQHRVSLNAHTTRFPAPAPNTHTARFSAPTLRRSVFCLASRLVLQPIGDNNSAHIKGSVDIEPAPSVVLPEGIYELGRVDTADIIVPLPTVSGRHAMVRVEEDKKVFITDLGSTNGTSIDSMELEPMKSVRFKLCYIDLIQLKIIKSNFF